MKVLLVTSDYPLHPGRVVGGVEGVCAYLVQAYRRWPGLDVEVLLANPRLAGSEAEGTVMVDGVRVHRVGRRPGWGYYGNVAWAIPSAVRRRIATIGCEIVHVQAMERVAAGLRRPSVLTIHGMNELDARHRGRPGLRAVRGAIGGVLARRARRRLDCVIAINPFVRGFLPGDGSRRVWDIPNPVADSFFAVERRPEPGRVLAAGRVSPLKNTAGLIRGFARLAAARPEARLRLAGAGGGAYEAECRSLVEALALTERVQFLGSLSVAELQEELAAASCLALASLHENAPLVISEAQAAGVPVAASKVGGIPHMIVEGETGRLFDPRDPADVQRALEQVLYADDVRAAGVAARAQAERNHRASVVADRTIEVYREILGWRGVDPAAPARGMRRRETTAAGACARPGDLSHSRHGDEPVLKGP